MAPSENRIRLTENLSNDDSTDADKDSTSSNETQSQALLKALQEFIIPLIQVVGQKQANGMNQIPLGPEAGKLIIALQEFISSIAIRSKSLGGSKVIEVALYDDDRDSDSDTKGDEQSSEEHSAPEASSSDSDGEATSDSNSEDEDTRISKESKRKFHDRLFGALKYHVDNKMPIRLLSFEHHGPTLRIALLSKGDIYNRLESVVKAKILQPGFHLASKFGNVNASMESSKDAIEDLIEESTRYAILSHTWLRLPGSAEVTYSDWNNGIYDAEQPGYQKLVNFCKTAWKAHKVAFGWMDTVCINKDSSSELDESIRSMYNWYSGAYVCITYLAETQTPSDIHDDPWFTRGWTLQELLAPRFIKFYGSNWKRVGKESNGNDKKDKEITKQIERATTITKDELHKIRDAPISRRMELAATRQVTREEDSAYSLMGIFDVSISIAYGEGSKRAFFRLLQEILASSPVYVLDIFNWAGKLPRNRLHVSKLLPSSPHSYRHRSTAPKMLLEHLWPLEPLTLTHQGLRVPLILMPGISTKDPRSHSPPVGDYYATVKITPYEADKVALSSSYSLLAKGVSGSDNDHPNGYQRTFAVFNFDGDSTVIRISKTCIAICLACNENVGKVSDLGLQLKFATQEPIVFNLKTTVSSKYNTNDDYYRIRPDKLAMHGMQLVSLSL